MDLKNFVEFLHDEGLTLVYKESMKGDGYEYEVRDADMHPILFVSSIAGVTDFKFIESDYIYNLDFNKKMNIYRNALSFISGIN